jgi:hypothetical protein
MKKFMVLYQAPAELIKQSMEQDSEAMAKGMEPWMKWKEKVGDAVVDFGTPLIDGHHMSAKDHGTAESDVTGYSILQAEDMEAAGKLLKDHPHLAWDDKATLTVFEMKPM